MQMSNNTRVLIIDDNPAIHEDFRKILRGTQRNASLDAKEAVLFAESQAAHDSDGFELDSAFQGEDGVEMVMEARREGRPYAVAFVDIRMPPGMDGVETIATIWPIDQHLQFVICSAYSDYSAEDILRRLSVSDRLLMLRKPCDSAEILLLATALCQKWNLAQTVKAR